MKPKVLRIITGNAAPLDEERAEPLLIILRNKPRERASNHTRAPGAVETRKMFAVAAF